MHNFQFLNHTDKVITGHKGTWTRFINHSSKYPNIEFVHLVIKRRNTIVVKAIRDIKFGDELRANYGQNYFQPGEIVDEPEDTPMTDGGGGGGGGRKRRHDGVCDPSETRRDAKRSRHRNLPRSTG